MLKRLHCISSSYLNEKIAHYNGIAHELLIYNAEFEALYLMLVNKLPILQSAVQYMHRYTVYLVSESRIWLKTGEGRMAALALAESSL